MESPGKGFTFRQVMIVVALILLAAVVLPIGVKAAGSQVTLVDDVSTGSGFLANVSFGKLHVGDGLGFLTVDGNVGTFPVLPADRVESVGVATSTATRYVGGARTGNKWVLATSITVTNTGSSSPTLRFQNEILTSGGTQCGDPISTTFVQANDMVSPAGQTVHLTFPTPKAFLVGQPSSTRWCLAWRLLSAPAGTSVGVQFLGYTIN